MLDIEYSDPQLGLILSYEGNSQCADCAITSTLRWCSIQNGVFLCTQCARKHKLFSSNISTIKSLEIDIFTKEDLTLLRLGGNSRFNSLMLEYNIPLTPNNQKYKYHTNIADYHRKCLHEEVINGGCLLDKPDLKSGIMLIDDNEQPPKQDTVTPLYDPNLFSSPIPSVERIEVEPKKEVDVGEEFMNVGRSLGKIFGRIGNGISNKMKEIGMDDTLTAAGDSAKKFFESSKEFISDKGKVVTQSDLFQNVKQKAESGIDFIQEKANEFMDQGNQRTSSINVRMSSVNNSNVNNGNVNVNGNVNSVSSSNINFDIDTPKP